MNNFGTNMITWYVIFPVLLIGLAGIIWFIFKMSVSPWKRVGITAISIFAFFGFTVAVLGVYYQFNKPFAAAFKTYSYSALAPDYALSAYHPTNNDPFQLPERGYGPMLATLEVYKENGQTKILRIPRNNTKWSGYIYTPGKWSIVDIENDVMTIAKDSDSKPLVTHTSLWWALTKDVYSMNASTQ
ncbi:MAG: hypothetical protein WC734_02735 [Patescibacteria group bacterium]|jgi:hypothetical protein